MTGSRSPAPVRCTLPSFLSTSKRALSTSPLVSFLLVDLLMIFLLWVLFYILLHIASCEHQPDHDSDVFARFWLTFHWWKSKPLLLTQPKLIRVGLELVSCNFLRCPAKFAFLFLHSCRLEIVAQSSVMQSAVQCCWLMISSRPHKSSNLVFDFF